MVLLERVLKCVVKMNNIIMNESKNVEVKAKVRNLADLVEKAAKISDKQREMIVQTDTFYKAENGRLKLREFATEDGELIFYDRPDRAGPRVSSYKKYPVGKKEDLQTLNTILTNALGIHGTVKKIRHLYFKGQTRIHVDSIEGLGNFMELEVVLEPNQSEEEGKTIAQTLLEELGIEKEDLISEAYVDLINKRNSERQNGNH